MYLDRGNRFELDSHFAMLAKQCLQLAFSLSGVWWPGSKWAINLAGSLSVAPVSFADRLRHTSQLSPEYAAVELATLVDEIYDLVELYLPEVDVTRLRAIFHFDRRPYV